MDEKKKNKEIKERYNKLDKINEENNNILEGMKILARYKVSQKIIYLFFIKI
jgi:hypothetical protein